LVILKNFHTKSLSNHRLENHYKNRKNLNNLIPLLSDRLLIFVDSFYLNYLLIKQAKDSKVFFDFNDSHFL